MKNLHEVRIQSGSSQKYVAQLANMSAQAIHRYEQMLYAKPSLNYLSALSEITLIPISELAETYTKARQARLEATYDLFRPASEHAKFLIKQPYNDLRTKQSKKHPYYIFRMELLNLVEQPLSDMHWCVLTCFHPAQLHRFETVGKQLPTVQREVLVKSGFESIIGDLNKMIKEYQGG